MYRFCVGANFPRKGTTEKTEHNLQEMEILEVWKYRKMDDVYPQHCHLYRVCSMKVNIGM